MTVSISCITYNHAPYIRQCLDGFLMQQCNFDFEILIHDDASTDGTQDIIREYQQKYPLIIKPILQTENQYSKGVRGINFKFNFPRAKGQLIALCEGDDYWTDPLKLQKQVDFLKENPDYTLVAGGFKSKDVTTGKEIIDLKDGSLFPDNSEKGFDITLDRFFSEWYTKTLTLVFRKDAVDLNVLKKYEFARDVHLNYHLLKNGRGYYMKSILGVYQKHEGGIFSPLEKKSLKLTHYKVFQDLYKYNKTSDMKSRLFYSMIGCSGYDNKIMLNAFKYISNITQFKVYVFSLKKQYL